MTLAARVRLIVWCEDCSHQIEPDPAEMATRHGAGTAVLDWRASDALKLLREIPFEKECLIPRVELDFEEQDLSSHLGGQSYRFHLLLIEPRLDMLYGMSERRSSRRFHINRIASRCHVPTSLVGLRWKHARP
jgi:hypothetical protein